MIDILKFIFSSPIYFFGIAFFVMLFFVGITEIISAYKMKEAKKTISEIVELSRWIEQKDTSLDYLRSELEKFLNQ